MAVEVRASHLKPEVSVVLLSGRLDMEAVETDSPKMLQALEQSAAGIKSRFAFSAFGYDAVSGCR